MTVHERSRPGAAGIELDPEFSAILDTMICACLPEPRSRACRLRNELFLRCDIEGQSLADAAETLDLEVQEARALLSRIRRDFTVHVVFGLSRPGVTNRQKST